MSWRSALLAGTIIAGLPAVSLAQTCPPNAFPFSQACINAADLNNAFNALIQGTTILYLPQGQTNPTVPGIVMTPGGVAVPNINSTQTMGFNEVEALDFANGWGTWVIGTGEYQGEGSNPPRSALITNNASGFVIKPLANRSLKFSNIQVRCNGAAAAGCMNVDSMMKGRITAEGAEFVQGVTTATSATCVWYLNAHTAIPNEGNTSIVDSHLEFGNVAIQPPTSGTGQAPLCVNLAGGAVNNNWMLALEINGENSANYGFIVYGTNGVNGFGGNILNFPHTHQSKIAGIQIGLNGTNAAFYGQNLYNLGTVNPSAGDGINTYTSSDIMRVGVISNAEGAVTNGVKLQTGASKNEITVGNIAGASTPLSDSSGVTTNVVKNGTAYLVPPAVTCPTGAPTSSFASINGIVTHC